MSSDSGIKGLSPAGKLYEFVRNHPRLDIADSYDFRVSESGTGWVGLSR